MAVILLLMTISFHDFSKSRMLWLQDPQLSRSSRRRPCWRRYFQSLWWSSFYHCLVPCRRCCWKAVGKIVHR